MATVFVNFLKNYFGVFVKATPYSLYVLAVLLLTFMLNQLDRFVLPVTAVETTQDLKFGTKGCLSLKNKNISASDAALCGKANQSSCITLVSSDNISLCKYDYNGQGTEYQVIISLFSLIKFKTNLFYFKRLLTGLCSF